MMVCVMSATCIYTLPPGSKKREIPRPTANPFTILFNFVSCPNYTYEVTSEGKGYELQIMAQHGDEYTFLSNRIARSHM